MFASLLLKIRSCNLVVAVVVAAMFPVIGRAQSPPQPAVVSQAPAGSEAAKPATETSKPQTPKQKELSEATAKLVTLANELKAEMDKSSKDTLSVGVMRKAEEVEKQARIVRDKMRAVLVN